MRDDTISRQAVVDLVEEVENKRLKGEIDLTYAPMINGIKALPPTETENIEEFKKNLLRTMNAGIVATNTKDVYSCGMRNGMRWCRSLLEDEPPKFEKASQYTQRWIPCDLGEPDEDMECWVTVKTTDALYRGSFTKRYGERRDKGFITSGDFVWWNTALAWMPIYEPEPYRPEGVCR